MIVNHIYHWASTEPDKPAIIDHDRPVSYRDFAGSIEAARRRLAACDLPAGMTAVVLADLLAPMWFIMLALRSLGLNTVCVASLGQIDKLRIRNVAAVVTTPHDAALHKITRPKAFGRRIIVMSDDLWQSPAAAPAAIADPDCLYGGHILYTSGTTGDYKTVLKEGRHEEALMQRCVVHRRIAPDSIVHMLGFAGWTGVGFKQPLSVWRMGATVIFDQTPDALASIFTHAPSFISLTPEQAWILVGRVATMRRPAVMPELNLVGGFVSRELIRSLRKAQCADLRISYSATECSHILRSHVEDDDRIIWLAPAEDRRVEVVDENGDACPPGQDGRLRVGLLDHDSYGYLDDPAATAAAFSDGWFYPGDLAVQREDGRIRILGRAGDVLNIKGQKMATAPLEQTVRQIARVSAVCLFQGVDLDGRDELVVVLEADRPPAPAVVDRIIASFAGVGRVRVETVGRFPRTTTGLQKTRRLALRRTVFGEGAGASG